jgi:hypothetical protein
LFKLLVADDLGSDILVHILGPDLSGFIVWFELLMDFVASADEQEQGVCHEL